MAREYFGCAARLRRARDVSRSGRASIGSSTIGVIGPVAVTGDGQLGGVSQFVQVFDEGGVMEKLLWIGQLPLLHRSLQQISQRGSADRFLWVRG